MPKLLDNITWDDVIAENKELCERGGFQHGFTSEGHEPSKHYYNLCRDKNLSFAELVDELRILHKRAPFLFLNGNTFCSIGLQIAETQKIHSEYLISSINHHIAGTNILNKQEIESLIQNYQSTKTKDSWDTTAQMILTNLKRGFSYKNEPTEINDRIREALKSDLIAPSSYLTINQIMTKSGQLHTPAELREIKQQLASFKLK